jgi:hypothetical protein
MMHTPQSSSLSSFLSLGHSHFTLSRSQKKFERRVVEVVVARDVKGDNVDGVEHDRSTRSINY